MIYLAQTDTTAGFLSKSLEELNLIKNRSIMQPCLMCVSSNTVLKNFSRVPNKFKNIVRRSKKTTFIYKNFRAIRVVRDCEHSEFLKSVGGWMFSTSANEHKKRFSLKFAYSKADIVIGDKFRESNPSKIYKLSINSIQKIR